MASPSVVYPALRLLFIFLILLFAHLLRAQQITGVWRGKMDKQKVELKMIQKGDSLTGTSYYYESAGHYRRYSIKGYFDPETNSVVWWDDQLIDDKKGALSGLRQAPLLASADFNCPGGGEMYLDGTAAPKEKQNNKGPVHLTKISAPSFADEWDFVLDNYTVGANDPYVIDSVGRIATSPVPVEQVSLPKEETPVVVQRNKPGMVVVPPMPEPERKIVPKEEKPLTVQEKFIVRQKVFTTEIPVEGDSVELRFYDNAEIDGDSISLFLNNVLLFTHIRLTDQAYVFRLPTSELNESNELVMVAENLGSIPPNTSFMVALVGDKRYEAKLASTENSSAMIRLRKTPPTKSAAK